MVKTKSQSILRKVVYGIVGVTALAFIIFFLIIRPLQIHRQKQNFAKAEENLDALAVQIQNTIGKADDSKKTKSCNQANLKSERGPLVCTISNYLLYANKNAEQSNDYMNKITQLGNHGLRKGSVSASGKEFISYGDRSGEQTFYQDFDSASNLECSFSYSYPGTEREFAVAGQNFEIGVICSGKSLSEIFP